MLFASVHYSYSAADTVYTVDKYIDFSAYNNVELYVQNSGYSCPAMNAGGTMLSSGAEVKVMLSLDNKIVSIKVLCSKAGVYNVNNTQFVGLVHAW